MNDTFINNNAIGIFDSGVGGISVANEIHEKIPGESVYFIADEKNFPYGEKTDDEIIKFADDLYNALVSKKVKAIVIACNTASSIAYDYLKNKNPDFPVVNVISATSKSAVRNTKNGNIGVICTEATKRSKIYERCINNFAKEKFPFKNINPFVMSHGQLANYIEYGDVKNIEKTIREVKDNFSKHHIDTLILGCTHYNLVYDSFDTAFNDINIVSSAEKTVDYLKKQLAERNLLNVDERSKDLSYYVRSTRPNAEFESKIKKLLKPDFIVVE